MEIVAATHSGMTTADFNKDGKEWLAIAKHPRFKVLYTDLVYQPMIELLDYLRANGFKTFIVSGGGVEFMRAFADKTYGVPPEQVIGSSGVTQYQMWDASPVLIKMPKVLFVDDGPGKPEGIDISSAGARSSLSAIPTATRRCWNGPRRATACASWASCIIPTQSANMPMTGSSSVGNSRQALMRATPRAGHRRHEERLEDDLPAGEVCPLRLVHDRMPGTRPGMTRSLSVESQFAGLLLGAVAEQGEGGRA